MEMGSYKGTCNPSYQETAAKAALWEYNSARARDGLAPLNRMPVGTRYTTEKPESACDAPTKEERLAHDTMQSQDSHPSYPQPHIHLNGTGRATLTRETEEARDSLMAAVKAFKSMTCHGRDFYILNDARAFEKAAAKREDMDWNLTELAEYLDARLTHLLDL